MLYRFRSIKSLVEYNELENEYMFFAAPVALNDPMEGYVDYYWRGDEIAWMGFFKNYAWQLYLSVFAAMLGEKAEQIEKMLFCYNDTKKDVKLFSNRSSIEMLIENDGKLQHLCKILGESSVKLDKTVLHTVCISFHMYILKIITDAYKSAGIQVFDDSFSFGETVSRVDNSLAALETTFADFSAEHYLVFKAAAPQFSALELATAQNSMKNSKTKSTNTVLFDFPRLFISALSKLTFPKSYSVSFCEDISNPALWGYYADNHKGVALIFDYCNNSEVNLSFKNSEGKSVPVKERIKKVSYSPDTLSLNYFESLGRINRTELEHWLCSGSKCSSIFSDCSFGRDELVENYWKINENRLLHKSSGWQAEQEYRLILNDSLDAFSAKESRIAHYPFSDLKGVIFGINAAVEDKLKVIAILNKKCKEHGVDDFSFFQAVFDPKTGTVVSEKIAV